MGHLIRLFFNKYLTKHHHILYQLAWFIKRLFQPSVGLLAVTSIMPTST